MLQTCKNNPSFCMVELQVILNRQCECPLLHKETPLEDYLALLWGTSRISPKWSTCIAWGPREQLLEFSSSFWEHSVCIASGSPIAAAGQGTCTLFQRSFSCKNPSFLWQSYAGRHTSTEMSQDDAESSPLQDSRFKFASLLPPI